MKVYKKMNQQINLNNYSINLRFNGPFIIQETLNSKPSFSIETSKTIKINKSSDRVDSSSLNGMNQLRSK